MGGLRGFPSRASCQGLEQTLLRKALREKAKNKMNKLTKAIGIGGLVLSLSNISNASEAKLETKVDVIEGIPQNVNVSYSQNSGRFYMMIEDPTNKSGYLNYRLLYCEARNVSSQKTTIKAYDEVRKEINDKDNETVKLYGKRLVDRFLIDVIEVNGKKIDF